MPDSSSQCEAIREIFPEVAMGVASGEARAGAMAHLVGCPDCRRELEEVTATVDELLLLAPEHEPPAGFETRVLNALDDRAPRRHLLRTSLVLAAAFILVAAIAASFVWVRSANDRDLADQYRHTLAVADGTNFRAADLTASG